ncbi:MAG: peptidoglycan bridge formation glycyltransferase FemA/FemB family protein [Candidatus Andersenbacteria bacterium]|nr:peptidoglycan bridge formation glycyltransferase FemA/FemB family protein [Candidatus Andersenbacteria bacterium]MBI3251171.1 peptidoglycan bridge formation glycyltransferase FemA/FemB family protein [Candidatus Andersenbacteria bacterium]
MNIRLAQEHDKEKWNQFVFRVPTGSVLQSWQWGQMQELLGTSHWRYVMEDGGTIVGVFLAIQRELPLGRSWLYVPRGPVMQAYEERNWPAVQDVLTELAKKEKAIFVRIDPFLEESQKPFFLKNTSEKSLWRKSEREVQPRHTLILSLQPTEEELLAQMHSKTRYNIRLAQRKEVQIRFSTSLNDIDLFLQLAQEVTKRTGFHYHPDNYYRAMLSVLVPDGMFEVAIAEYKEQPVAVHLMSYAGKTATYIHGASSHAHRSTMAPQLLYWETIRRAKSKGMELYDFFGVAPQDASADHPWSGITRVKQGFGGTYESYIGAYDFIVSDNMYELFNTTRRVWGLFR